MRKCLLDSSFVIDLLNEIADGKAGSASSWLKRNPAARLWITPVTLAEVLEGAEDPEAVRRSSALELPTRIIAAHGADRQRRGCCRQVAATVGMQNRCTPRTPGPGIRAASGGVGRRS